ncbi:acyl-CoA dehydrogenase family protein [Frankia sp. Ag45/Mut15]|uniref:Acyl-CoA dehydrogenase family protein n=1 Tax=Frankia umida TaxID=573489 RepID=A0ABT0JWL6_9ACTN|nr:acyl-CoA dehydrogenase family protein [Frankia umida]MCK9875940.1 acyl-CoA dehydrogenase family protein [Frankia umida]
MPDTGLSDEQEALRRSVAEFAREVVAPVAAHHDEQRSFPYEVVAAMARMGLFGLPFPERYGGMGGDLFSLCLAIEELARVDSSVAITLEAGCGLGAMPIYRFGTEEQRQRWLPALCAGEALGAFGLTEPEAGSDAGGTRTSAELVDGAWVVNGSKSFITNSGTDITRLVTVTARTSPASSPSGRTSPSGGGGGPPREISAIVVPVPSAGLEVGPAYSKVGWHASDTHPLTLTDVRVPADHLLGERGRGYANFLAILAEGRIAISALAVGLAQGCVDESVAYARSRRAFGQPIASHQGIAFMIAEMEARTHVARTAYYDAAARVLAGRPFAKEAAIAKLVSSAAAVDNARDATQIHGGNGFMNEYPVARHWRDSKILEIGEGTSEIQKLLIARHLGL